MAALYCSSPDCSKPASRRAVALIDRATHDVVEVWLCAPHAEAAERRTATDGRSKRARFLRRVRERTAI